MNKFIKLNVIKDNKDIEYFVNINHVVYIYIKDNHVHLKLINDNELKLKDNIVDIILDKIFMLS